MPVTPQTAASGMMGGAFNPLSWLQGLGHSTTPAAAPQVTPGASPPPQLAAPAGILPPPQVHGNPTNGSSEGLLPRPQITEPNSPKEAQAAMQEQVQSLQQIQQQIQAAGAEPQAPVVPPPKLLSLPPEPPEEKYRDPAEVFGGVGGMVMLLGSALTKPPMTAALNYYTGMMKGFHEGDVEKVKLAHDQWTQSMESVEKQNKQMLDEFSAVNKSQELSVRQKQAQLNVLFHQYQIPEAIIRANKESFDTGEKYVTDMNKAHDKMFKGAYATAQDKAYNGYVQMATQDLTNITRAKTNILRDNSGLPPDQNSPQYETYQKLLADEKKVEEQREKYMKKRQQYRDAAAGIDTPEGETPDEAAAAPEESSSSDDQAPMPGAKQAADGNWYVETEPGKFAKVE